MKNKSSAKKHKDYYAGGAYHNSPDPSKLPLPSPRFLYKTFNKVEWESRH